MKIKHLFLSLLAVAAVAVSCQKSSQTSDKASLEISPATLSFEATASTQSVTVTSNRDWKIEDEASLPAWIKVTKVSDTEASVAVEANSGNDRSQDVVFRVVGVKKTLSVSQKGEKGEVKQGDGTQANPYTPSQAYTKASTLSSSESVADVYVSGIISKLGDFGGASYGNYTYYLSDDGTTSGTQFEVYRGYYIDGAKFTSADLLKVGDVVVVCGKLVNYNGETPEMTSGSKIISVNGNADAAPGLSVSATSLLAEATATSVTFTVSGNVDWTVASDNADFTVSPASGNGNATVTVSFSANTTSAARTCNITVSTTNEEVATKSYTIVLTQKAPDAAGVISATVEQDYLAENQNGKVDDVVSYTNDSDYGSNTVTELRVYKNKTLTITAATGYSIQSVEFTCTADCGSKAGFYTDTKNVTVDSGATAACAGSGKVGTITVTGNTSKVAYTANDNQMRVTKMTVKYIKAE